MKPKIYKAMATNKEKAAATPKQDKPKKPKKGGGVTIQGTPPKDPIHPDPTKP